MRLKNTITLCIPRDPQNIDPRKKSTRSEGQIQMMLLEGLISLDSKDKIQLAQADHYEISNNFTKYSFHIRESAYWSNGKKVTAMDFEATWKSSISSKENIHSAMTNSIKNGVAAARGLTKRSQIAIKSKNTNTLEVELNRPIPYFLKLVASRPFLPLSYGSVYLKSLDIRKIICNGPFKVLQANKSEAIRLDINKFYWQSSKTIVQQIDIWIVSRPSQAIYLYVITIVDLIGDPFYSLPFFILQKMYKEKTSSTLSIGHPIGTHFISLNTQANRLSDNRIRKNLLSILDQNQLSKEIFLPEKHPVRSLIPPPSQINNLIHYPVDKCNEYEAIRKEDMPSTISMKTSNSPFESALSSLIAKSWKAKYNTQVLMRKDKQTQSSANGHAKSHDACLGYYHLDAIDPVTSLLFFSQRSKAQWQKQYIEKISNIGDRADGYPLFYQLINSWEEKLSKEAIIAPLAYEYLLLLKHPYVCGVQSLNTYGYLDLRNACIQDDI